MANVVRKHSISSELAQKMVDAAVQNDVDCATATLALVPDAVPPD